MNRLAQIVMHCYPFPRGQGRIIDRTMLRRLRFDESVITVRCSDGFDLKVMPNDHIGRHLYLTGQFDRTIVEVMQSFCKDGERILDIGANVGYVSCALLHNVQGCQVVSVEPLPQCFELLSQNVAVVGKGRGKALNVAVSEASGSAVMRVTTGNTGGSRLLNGEESQAAIGDLKRVVTVNGERLLELSRLDRIDLIKIDVEGHEEPVFCTLANVIETQRPRAIVFEHDGDLAASSSAIGRILRECRYRVFGLHKTLLSWSLIPLEELMMRRERAHDYVGVPVEATGPIGYGH